MRYVAKIEVYVYADSNQEAYNKTEALCNIINDVDDGGAMVTGLAPKNTAWSAGKEINLDPLRARHIEQTLKITG